MKTLKLTDHDVQALTIAIQKYAEFNADYPHTHKIYVDIFKKVISQSNEQNK